MMLWDAQKSNLRLKRLADSRDNQYSTKCLIKTLNLILYVHKEWKDWVHHVDDKVKKISNYGHEWNSFSNVDIKTLVLRPIVWATNGGYLPKSTVCRDGNWSVVGLTSVGPFRLLIHVGVWSFVRVTAGSFASFSVIARGYFTELPAI